MSKTKYHHLEAGLNDQKVASVPLLCMSSSIYSVIRLCEMKERSEATQKIIYNISICVRVLLAVFSIQIDHVVNSEEGIKTLTSLSLKMAGLASSEVWSLALHHMSSTSFSTSQRRLPAGLGLSYAYGGATYP